MANSNSIPVKQYDIDGIRSFSNHQADLAQFVCSYFIRRKEIRTKYAGANSDTCVSNSGNLAHELLVSNFDNAVNTVYISLSGMVYYNDIRKDLKDLQGDIDSMLDAIDVLEDNGIKGAPVQAIRNEISKTVNGFVRKFRSIAGLCDMIDAILDDDKDGECNA